MKKQKKLLPKLCHLGPVKKKTKKQNTIQTLFDEDAEPNSRLLLLSPCMAPPSLSRGDCDGVDTSE